MSRSASVAFAGSPECRWRPLRWRGGEPADRRADRASPTEGPPGRLLLLDGHSLAYRAFFALPVENFSTTTGQPTNAVYGFTSMLITSCATRRPPTRGGLRPVATPTFRHTAYPAYKATRSETPHDFKGQVSLIHEVLEALRSRGLGGGLRGRRRDRHPRHPGRRRGMDVLIVTGDRDAFQLVTDQVTVLYTVRGISDMVRYTPEAGAESTTYPSQYPDYAALRGDPSDNLPGIPGVGRRPRPSGSASSARSTPLVDRVDEVKGKTGDALRDHLSRSCPTAG